MTKNPLPHTMLNVFASNIVVLYNMQMLSFHLNPGNVSKCVHTYICKHGVRTQICTPGSSFKFTKV